jgi:hypothetical protein
MFHPPQSEANEEGGGSSSDVDRYVLDLKTKMRKAHDIARTKLKAAQKVMKRDYDVKVRGAAFGVGDLVYWRRNVGKKVESKWMGPGIIVEVKSDTIYAVKLRKQIKIIHFDKLKICRSRQIPQWLRDFQAKNDPVGDGTLDTRVTPRGSAMHSQSHSNPNQPLNTSNSAVNSKHHSINPTKPGERSVNQDKMSPYFTRSKAKGTSRSSKSMAESLVTSKGRSLNSKTQKTYCLCEEVNPKGLMVQCSDCKDWFHPQCVGITDEFAKRIPVFICPECKSN